MSTSPILLIDHILQSQNQKEVTANAFIDAMEASIHGYLAKAMTDANLTLADPDEACRYGWFEFTGTLTADRDVIVPDRSKIYIVKNSTTGGHAITVKTDAGTGVSVAASSIAIVASNGTNVVLLATPAAATLVTAFTELSDAPASYSGQGGKSVRVNAGATALEFFTPAAAPTQIYIPSVTFNGKPTASLVLVRHPVAGASGITLPANCAGSHIIAEVAATASTVFSLLKNGVSIGTATFAVGGTVATIASSATTLADGDIFKMVAPLVPDATLADLGISFYATR